MATTRILQRRSNLGETIVDFASRINPDITGLGNITVTAFCLTYYRQGVFQLTMSYLENCGSPHALIGAFDAANANDPTGSADVLDAFFQATPKFTAKFIRSVSAQDNRKTDVKSVLAIYETDAAALDAHPWKRGLKIVVPAGNIAAGATGAADIINTVGATVATITLRNRGQNLWPAGREGFAFNDEQACEFVGYTNV